MKPTLSSTMSTTFALGFLRAVKTYIYLNCYLQVTVNGVEYQPNVASANKKQAKADAAQLCLQKLGLLPN